MSLPAQIQVRISSEAAGFITVTPVISQLMPLRELTWVILSATGKDSVRVQEVLARGMVVQGASRFRWEALPAAAGDVEALVSGFPEADASRPFRRDQCDEVRFHVGPRTIEVPCEIASRRRLFRRRSFWDALMDLAGSASLDYAGYSYRTRADHYRLRLSLAAVAELRGATGLIRHSGLARQLRAAQIESVEFVVRFP